MKNLIKTLFGTLTPWGKVWCYVGIVTLFAAAGMSFMVGWKMTALHALFLACLSFVTAFLPMAAENLWQEGRKGVAIALAFVSIPLFMIEFGQHAAYTAGIRGYDLATTKVQNVKYDGAQDEVKEAKATEAMFSRRLADLETKAGWSASATADGLRANLETAQKAIDLETARGGCKAKCLDLMKQKAGLEERIKTLEARDDYTAKITAAKAVIARAREKANTVEHKSSQTEHMNAFLSKAVALIGQGSLKPDEATEEGTQLSANLAMALAGTALPAIGFFCAGLFRRKDDDIEADVARETVSTSETIASNPANLPAIRPMHITTTTSTIADLRSRLNHMRQAA